MRVLLALVLMTSTAFAQTKDRKDFIIDAMTIQRDSAQRDAATCYADANIQIAKLNAEITELKAKLESKTETK